ncbi:MAG: hypothetical protein ACREM6_09515 [Vulcanimicrobiaceae bacterium]
MRRNPIPPLVFIGALLAGIGAYAIFQTVAQQRYVRTRMVANSRSTIVLSLAIDYSRGPLVSETYRMSDLDGLSALSYRGVNRNGLIITVQEPPRKTLQADANVAYFFDRVVADGIWQVSDKAPRGDRSATYTIAIAQTADGVHGSRRIVFSDPQYWATTAGRQYRIVLHKGDKIPDLLHLQGTSIADPRYLALVDDFLRFGPPSFHAKVASERTRLSRPARVGA